MDYVVLLVDYIIWGRIPKIKKTKNGFVAYQNDKAVNTVTTLFSLYFMQVILVKSLQNLYESKVYFCLPALKDHF